MQFSLLQSTLTTLLGSFFDETTTCAWFIGNQQSYYIHNQRIENCTIEETVVVKKITNDLKSAVFQVSKTALLFRIRPEIKTSSFHKINFLSGESLLISTVSSLEIVVIFERILKNQLADLAKRQHILHIIDNESTKTNSLQQENAALRLLRKNEVQVIIHQWEKSLLPNRVIVTPSFYQKIDLLSTNEAIVYQLNTAFELIQFLTPGLNEYQLTAVYFTSSDNQQQASNKRINNSISLTRNRAELLLDKYEQAAQVALDNAQVINGKTIANFLQPAVSPPAITDALKKNRKAIKALLDENPSKWGLLRNYLKPIKNISELSSLTLQAGFN